MSGVFTLKIDNTVKGLSAKQLDAVTLLVSGMTYAEAAHQLGISERTVRRYMADPAFKEALITLREQVSQMASNMLIARMANAVAVLVEIMQNPPERHGALRLNAAKTILDYAFKVRSQDAAEGRLKRLEEAVAALGTPEQEQSLDDVMSSLRDYGYGSAV